MLQQGTFRMKRNQLEIDDTRLYSDSRTSQCEEMNTSHGCYYQIFEKRLPAILGAESIKGPIFYWVNPRVSVLFPSIPTYRALIGLQTSCQLI